MTDSVRAVALVSAAAAAGVLWRCRRAAAPSCPPLIGIMAGMGPKAGAEFFASLVDGRVALFRAMAAAATGDAGGMLAAVAAMSDAPWTAAEVAAVWRRTEKRGALDDADHVPALVYSNAQIPNRPRFLDGTRADDPLPELLRTARVLFRGGATVLCIVCNTAHAWLAPIQAALDADAEAAGAGEAGPRLLSKPRQALLAVRRRCGRGGGELGQSDRQTKDRRLRVGLLATSGTLSSGVYASAAADVAVDAEILAPTEDGQRAVEEVIFGLRGIKAGCDDVEGTAEGRNNFDALLVQVQALADAGADAVVLGCTELGCNLSPELVRRLAPPPVAGVVLVDASKSLADTVLWLGLTDGN